MPSADHRPKDQARLADVDARAHDRLDREFWHLALNAPKLHCDRSTARHKPKAISGRREDARQYFSSTESDDPAVLEHHDLRRQLPHFAGVMTDIDHRYAGLVTQPHEIRQDLFFAF